jgi:hypothetical protein
LEGGDLEGSAGESRRSKSEVRATLTQEESHLSHLYMFAMEPLLREDRILHF